MYSFRLFKIQRRIYIATQALEYYSSQQWTFENKNFLDLRSKIKTKDKRDFFYDAENINRYEYIINGSLGNRRYLLNEPDEDIPKAKAHFFRSDCRLN